MSDAAIANIVTGIVTTVTLLIGFLTLWVKLRYGVEKTEEVARRSQQVESKVDHNTLVTKAGTDAAVRNAKMAAETATTAAETAAEVSIVTRAMAESIDKKLNGGGIDAAIESAIQPIRESLAKHTVQDDRNMNEIRTALNDLRKRIK